MTVPTAINGNMVELMGATILRGLINVWVLQCNNQKIGSNGFGRFPSENFSCWRRQPEVKNSEWSTGSLSELQA